MKWWKIVLICIAVLLIIGSAWWYFYRETPVEEGFQAASLQVVSNDTLHPSSVLGTESNTGSYTIFDPSAAYLQAKIFEIEYGPPLGELAQQESNFTTNILPRLLTSKVMGGEYKWGESVQRLLIFFAGESTASKIAAYNAAAAAAATPARAAADASAAVQGIINYNEPPPPEITADIYRNITNYPRSSPLNSDDIKAYYTLRDSLFTTQHNISNKFNNNPMGYIFGNKGSYKINCGIQQQDILSSSFKNNGWVKTNIYTDTKTGNYMNTSSVYEPNQTITSFRDFMCQQFFMHNTDKRLYINSSCGGYCQLEAGIQPTIAMWNNSKVQTEFNIYLNAGGLNMKTCAKIPGEKTNPSIPATILTNPTSWTLQSFMTNQSPMVSTLIGNFVASKPSSSKLLYASIPVVGTISEKNKQEIRDSIRYAMYFNFRDTSTIENQIRVSAEPPCNLYMSPDCSGMTEFMFFKGQTIYLDGTISGNNPDGTPIANAVANNNIHCNQLVTDEMLKYLPYHTRDYIRRWAIKRRTRLATYFSQKCEASKQSMLNHFSNNVTITPNLTNNRGIFEGYFDRLKPINTYCCGSSDISQKSYINTYTSSFTSGAGTFDKKYLNYDPGSGQFNQNRVSPLTKTCSSGYTITMSFNTYTLPAVPTMNTRTYKEAKGDTSNGKPGTNDIAPYLDLMSTPEVDPSVFMTKTLTSAAPSVNKDTSKNDNTYTTTLVIQNNINFLRENMQVEVASYSNSKTYFNGIVKSYNSTTGSLVLNRITYNNIFVDGAVSMPSKDANNNYVYPNTYPAVTSPPTPPLPSDIYTISYTDIGSISKEINSSNTAYAELINPSTGSVTLNISIDDFNVFSTGNLVLVSNVSNPSNNFKGTITSITNKVIATQLVIGSITSIGSNTNFSTPATYSVTKYTENANGRFWLTPGEKSQILNIIAQAYYELTGGTNRINNILDVFQVGDTIFDLRFQNLDQDAGRIQYVQEQMAALRAEYVQYRSYNLAQDEFLQLEQSYLKNMINLNKQLDGSVQGISTDCGISAFQIRIRRVDTNTTGIQLSQVVVIDNTGNNAAYGNLVTASSTKVYDYENPPDWRPYPNGTSINATGTILNSSGSTISAPNTCWPLTTTTAPYKSANCSTINGIIHTKPMVDSSNQNATIKSIIYNRNQSIVDGDTGLRAEPNYYTSGSNLSSEYVLINLGSTTDIVKVILYFPINYTEIPTYTITLQSMGYNDIQLPEGIINTISTIIPASPGIPATSTQPAVPAKPAHMVISFMKPTARNPDLPSCPTELINPYKVARFYTSSIAEHTSPVNPTKNIENFRVTGYSMGIEAALTFNPKYNAGFTLNLGAGAGNINYSPIIEYKLNGVNNSYLVDTSSECVDSKGVTNILKDYMANLSNIDFTSRADVIALGYDTTINSYHPIQVLGSSYNNTTSTCNIHWKELMVDIMTNQRSAPIERWGSFTYVNNKENWGAIDSYYDITKSRIFSSTDSSKPSISPYPAPIAILNLLPQEALSLDTLGGQCPPVKCSDIGVITQLIKEYNTRNPNTRILRITKAFTANENRCDFQCRQEQTDGTIQEKNISIELDVSISMDPVESELDMSTYSCKYNYSNIFYDTHPERPGGQYIQENTPVLSYVFNYVTEVLSPYIKNIESIQESLTKLYNKSNAMNILRSYRQDTYGAYGQIQELDGCAPVFSGTGKNSCSDQSIQNEFVRFYNSINDDKISNIQNVGTASLTECDFVVTTGGINGLDYTDTTKPPKAIIGTGGVTRGYRAAMNVDSNGCYFTVSSMKNYTINLTDADIKNMSININTALNQPAWTTPVTLGTLVTPQTISSTATTASLIVPRSNSYTQGAFVTIIDKADIQNTFKARIGSYTPGTTAGTTATLSLININSMNGTFGTPSIYMIQEVPPVFNSIIPNTGIETRDFVDCRAPGKSGFNTSAFTCGDTQLQSFSLLNVPGSASSYGGVVGTMDATKMNILYPGAQSIISVGGDTWDVRITPSDNLLFTDTFKTIQVGSINGVNRIRSITNVNSSSKFCFFTINPISNIIGTCATIARSYWNTQYSTATDQVNKKILGNISGYYSMPDNNTLVFKAIKCEFGPNGPLDIRVDPVETHYRVEFRQTISTTRPHIVFLMSELTSAPSGTLNSYTNSYSETSSPDPTYILKSVRDSMQTTNIYRYLRFKVLATASSSSIPSPIPPTPTSSAAEISQISFYKTTGTALTATSISGLKEITFMYGTYNVDGLPAPNISMYRKPPFAMTTTPVTITPVADTPLILTVDLPSVYEPQFSNNDSVFIYNYSDSTTFFRGVITNITGNKLTITSITNITGTSYSVESAYAVTKNMCAAGSSPFPDTQKLSYAICRANSLINYTMLTPTIQIPSGATENLPCAIGFEKDRTITTKCNLTANFSRVNINQIVLNPLTPRLKLNLGQALVISLNNNEKVDYFSFTTGAARARPTLWTLEGSMDGVRWFLINSPTSPYQYTGNTASTSTGKIVYSFIETNYFPTSLTLTGAPLTNPHTGVSNNYIFENDPSTSTSTPITESFQNPTILDTPTEPKFRRRVPTLNNSYTLPLNVHTSSSLNTQMPVQAERRIQYLRLKIIDTRSKSQTTHMASLQFITALGTLPTKYYKITNPMGIHPSSKHGPDALSDSTRYWINSNRQPLLIKFSSLPATALQGFQFSAPSYINSNPFDNLPSEWIMEGSYDGRTWEIYNKTTAPSIFDGYISPVYKFTKEI